MNYLEMQVAWTIKFVNHMALNSETKLGFPCMKKVLGFYTLVTDTDAESFLKERCEKGLFWYNSILKNQMPALFK